MNLAMNYFNRYIINPYHFSGSALTILILAMLLILIFEVWMIVDVLAFRKVPTRSRIAWVVGMFLIHPLVAMAYLLIRSRYKKVK